MPDEEGGEEGEDKEQKQEDFVEAMAAVHGKKKQVKINIIYAKHILARAVLHIVNIFKGVESLIDFGHLSFRDGIISLQL